MKNHNIIGKIEKIKFVKPSIICLAKIDTGAAYSVIHVDKILKHNDCFFLYFTNKNFYPELNKKRIKYKVKRISLIKIKTSMGLVESRYKIKLRFFLGDDPTIYTCYFTITNRSNMEYPVLLGCNFLKKYGFLVDVSKEFLFKCG